MVRKAIGWLVAVAVGLAVGGCSGESGGDVAPTAVSPPSSGSAVTATTSSSADDMREVCEITDSVVNDQLLDMALAIGSGEEGPALRASVVDSYDGFARRLIDIALRGEVEAPADLVPVLLEWASASTAVARYIAETEPAPGLVIDYGPTQPRWDSARKAAEGVCGHPLGPE
jgi:hypothetical protein